MLEIEFMLWFKYEDLCLQRFPALWPEWQCWDLWEVRPVERSSGWPEEHVVLELDVNLSVTVSRSLYISGPVIKASCL